MQISNKKNNKAILAAGIGNFIEVYDYSHFIYLSSVLISAFFPHSDRSKALFFIFGIYAIERAIRPFMGILMGRYVDIHGRSKMLNFSVIGMASISLLICFIPTNQSNSLLAPMLFLIIRLFQGIFISSEFVTCMVYITEVSPQINKGFYGSIAFLSGMCGAILSSIVALLITYCLSSKDAIHWGWKIPYLLGFFMLLLSYKLRKNLSESPEFFGHKDNKISIAQVVISQFKNITFCSVLTLLSATVYSIFLVYMPTHLNVFKQLNLSTSIKLNTFNMCFYAILLPIMGKLSDITGRKTIISFICFIIAFFSYPIYYLLNNVKNIISLEITLSIMIMFIAALNASLPTFLCELFHSSVRTTSMAIGFGISLSFAGGIAPLVCLYLPMLTNNINSPAIYIMILALITIYVLFTNAITKNLNLHQTQGI